GQPHGEARAVPHGAFHRHGAAVQVDEEFHHGQSKSRTLEFSRQPTVDLAERFEEAPEGLERLFKPFSQIDSGLARKFEGTGLGLAMVKLLVDLHGGTVAVESAVGDGSCFTVWLPFRETDEGTF